MNRRTLAAAALGAALAATASLPAFAQESIKVGLILPMTGPFASTGRQVEAAAKLYLAQNGATVAGRKVELIVKDDASVADTLGWILGIVGFLVARDAAMRLWG